MAVAQVVEVAMPRLSDSMEEGTIVRWLKDAGDMVQRGEVLAEVETDKATMEYEAEDAGVLEIVVGDDGRAAVGAPIARLHPEGTSPEAFGEAGGGAPEPPTPTSTPAPARAARVPASPVARRLARGLGIELGDVTPTGRRGQVMKADVLALADRRPPVAEIEHTPAAPRPATPGARGAVSSVGLSRLQRTVATRMAQSRATVPDFDVEMDIDMTACVALREELRAHAERPPSINDFIMKACAIALREHPQLNGAFRDDAFELYERVNVGMAVATQDGLVVPVIADADRKSVGTIAAEARELAGKVRDQAITPPDLSGGTFTVSNLGMFGVGRFTAVIDAPQAAILAVGAVEERPVVRDGVLAVATMMTATLACDHRIVYGADAARFLARTRELLQTPMRILL